MEVAPRNLRWALRKFARNDYALEVKSPELARVALNMDRGSRRVSRSIAGVGCMLTGAILIQADKGDHWGDFPIIAIVFLVLGLFFTLRPSR